MRPLFRSTATIALFGSLALATAPLLAATPAAAPMAQAGAPASAPADAAKHSAKVEANIASLKKQLKITDAQSSQWDAYAQVMRDNGQAMETALQERDAMKGINAVDDLQGYGKITQAHADGVQKLIPAFQALYQSMTPDQQKNADKLFEDTRTGTPGGKKK